MKNKILSGLAGLVLAGYIGLNENTRKMGQLDAKSYIPAMICHDKRENLIYVPAYSRSDVLKNYCLKYVMLAAKEIFNIDIMPNDAWNRRYHDRVIANLEDESIYNAINEGKVNPGMISGIFNPYSFYNFKKDENGNSVKYTHVALFLGTNRQGRAFLAHKYRSTTEVIEASEFEKRGLRIVEILDPRR